MSRISGLEKILSVVKRHNTERATVALRNEGEMWVPLGARGVFGGVFVGQAIAAAMESVPDADRGNFRPHSFHAYFVKAGKSGLPVDYKVTSIRDGRNYLAREVKAMQLGEVTFTASVSLSRMKDAAVKYNKVAYQKPFPAYCKPPEECLTITDAFMQSPELRRKIPDEKSVREIANSYLDSGPEWRFPQDAFNSTVPLARDGGDPSSRSFYFWIKSKENLVDKLNSFAALGYMSDSFFLMGFQRLLGHAPFTAEFTVSLDHALYIHSDKVDADDWLLYHITTSRYQDTRALMHGEIYTREGECVASVVQEGLVMPDIDYAETRDSKL
ncbi:hypothetical protein BABINDRAFT_134968 [Babjeviella inositovora NRRL Y-12698]|uniref:Acyl-CoA thioesterase II n=1 Tax=Babjeviella inositovora NRRL Y-12698 TaxID=984486 RepID=A0A1E3QPU6_9ASCO|nr:uncharacterized protein BABINDRAFT_134968 [Babjeviella inositovora NRRL Y-12698]ODQ79729.1 hypothetical protein BABINDRAFT_134968 [Babjeviella inositovora NRRL Y-12698]